MKTKNNSKVAIDPRTRETIVEFLARRDVCLAQVERETGIRYQRLKTFSEATVFEHDDLVILRSLAKRGKPVRRKQRENHQLAPVEDCLRDELLRYIERDDVCVSAVEKEAGMTSGTLKRIAEGETRHTRRPTINKIRQIIKKSKSSPARSRNLLDPREVVDKFNKGVDAPSIAAEAGTTRQAVYHILKESGIEMSVPASDVAAAVRKYCATHQITVNAFCEKNGVDTSFLYSKGMMHKQHADRIYLLLEHEPDGIPKAQKALNPRLVARLKSQGLNHKQIAEELGVHIVTVSRAMRRLREEAEKHQKVRQERG